MYYSIKEVSEKTNISIKTIRRNIKAGYLLADKVSNVYRISLATLTKWSKSSYKINVKDSEMVKDLRNIIDIDEYDNVELIDIKEEFYQNDYWGKKLPVNAPKFAEMFSGAGGLALGFIKAGFKPIMNVEFMPAANKTYNTNINKKYNINDIKDPMDITIEENKRLIINKLKKEGVDIITGGFPCQGFSMAGDRVIDDNRNKLYLDLLEIVREVKPAFIMMENVLGLRTMLAGKVEKKIISDFRNIGYKINLTVLNSADFGVPQTRKRVIFIGNRVNKENLFPLPVVKKYKTSGEVLSKKISKNIHNHLTMNHSEDMINRISKLKYGESLYKNYSDAWKKLDPSKPSPTIKENHGGTHIHPYENRVITPREMAMLQSFPNDYFFEGSKSQQMVQIGNAVPPLMAKAIALSIKKSF